MTWSERVAICKAYGCIALLVALLFCGGTAWAEASCETVTRKVNNGFLLKPFEILDRSFASLHHYIESGELIRTLENIKFVVSDGSEFDVDLLKSRLPRSFASLLSALGQSHRQWGRLAKPFQEFLSIHQSRIFHFYREPGLSAQMMQLARDLMTPALRFMLPWGGFFIKTPTSKIFSKLRNGQALDVHDQMLIARYKIESEVSQKQAFVRKYPSATLAVSVLQRALEGIKLVIVAAAMHFSFELLANEDAVQSTQSFVNAGTARGRIQLLIESTPFPHTALNINGRVYSFGVERLEVFSLAEYMTTHRARQSAEPGFLQRGVTVVDIHFEPERVAKIVSQLESQSFKRYVNKTCTHDCSTMAMKALGFENRLFDASPSFSAMFLGLQKRLGDPTVGKISLVVDDPDYKYSLVARNTYIGMMDAMLIYRGFLYFQGERAAVEWSGQPVVFDDVFSEKMRESFRDTVRASERVIVLEQGLKQWASEPHSTVLKRIISRRAEEMLGKAEMVLAQEHLRFEDYYSAKYEKEYALEVKAKLGLLQ